MTLTYLISELDRNYYATIALGCLMVTLIVVVITRNHLTNFNLRNFLIKKFLAVPETFSAARMVLKSNGFVPESIVSLDEEGSIIYANIRVEKLFGYKSVELLKQKIGIIIPARYLENLERFIHRKEDFTDENCCLDIEGMTKAGAFIPIEVRVGRWREPDEVDIVEQSEEEKHEHTNYTIIMRDISHRVRAEEARLNLLKEITAVANMALTAERITGSGSWRWYLDVDNVEYSKGFSEMFWLNPKEKITAASLIAMVYYEDRPAINAALKEALENQKEYVVEYRIVQKDGSKDLVRCFGSPETSVNNKTIIINGAIVLLKKNVA